MYLMMIILASGTLSPLNETARKLTNDLDACGLSGDDHETSVLHQHLPVIEQRFNSVLLHDRFLVDGQPE